MNTIYNILDLTDDDLKQLMEKYKEKKMRYDQMYNEATIRNERIILNIHLEQVRRFKETHLKAYRDAKMDTTD
jgi:NADP-dependent 3-hydroxy acid dehydrogenase YdfG